MLFDGSTFDWDGSTDQSEDILKDLMMILEFYKLTQITELWLLLFG